MIKKSLKLSINDCLGIWESSFWIKNKNYITNLMEYSTQLYMYVHMHMYLIYMLFTYDWYYILACIHHIRKWLILGSLKDCKSNKKYTLRFLFSLKEIFCIWNGIKMWAIMLSMYKDTRWASYRAKTKMYRRF